MGDNFLDDFEVEASSVFKQPASDLKSVTNLESTLKKFGFTKDDRMERRDMVIIYKTVEKDMEKEISDQAHDGAYDGAKEMRARLTNIRNEFDGLQTSAVSIERDDQRKLFEKASIVMQDRLKSHLEIMDEQTRQQCEIMRAELNHTHQIQWENLEKEINRIPRPAMKFSRRLIELFKAEAGYVPCLKKYIYCLIFPTNILL